MLNRENTKIFIDTNIWLGLYNSNDHGKVNEFLNALDDNKNILVTTEQARNEYLRNRERVIKTSIANFGFKFPTLSTTSYIRSFSEFNNLNRYIKNAKENVENLQKETVKRIEETLSDPLKDDIYSNFINLWTEENIIPLTDDQFKLAFKRKMLGEPPGGDKDTMGDEIIWEALINTLRTNLIIVSRDKTYELNREYLQHEYEKETNQILEIHKSVNSAFSRLQIEMNTLAIEAEKSIKWDVTEYDLDDEEYLDADYYKELDDSLYLKCDKCNFVFEQCLDYIDSADERPMGYQIVYEAEIEGECCPKCKEEYYVKVMIQEYPEGCFTPPDYELEGVTITEDSPILDENQTTFDDEKFNK